MSFLHKPIHGHTLVVENELTRYDKNAIAMQLAANEVASVSSLLFLKPTRTERMSAQNPLACVEAQAPISLHHMLVWLQQCISLRPCRLSLKKWFAKTAPGCLGRLPGLPTPNIKGQKVNKKHEWGRRRKAFHACSSTFYAIRSHHQKLRRDIRLNIRLTYRTSSDLATTRLGSRLVCASQRGKAI